MKKFVELNETELMVVEGGASALVQGAVFSNSTSGKVKFGCKGGSISNYNDGATGLAGAFGTKNANAALILTGNTFVGTASSEDYAPAKKFGCWR